MEAFKSENRGGKGLKKMINQCANLVKKTEKLSKFANESLAKVEKVREVMKSKKLMEGSKHRLKSEMDI